jgi:hypothetical protein
MHFGRDPERDDIDAVVGVLGERILRLDARHAAAVPGQPEVVGTHALDGGDDLVGEGLVKVETRFLSGHCSLLRLRG